MFEAVIVSTIAVFFAYLAKNEANRGFLKVSFFILFLFLALRYNFGNDYPGYLEGFEKVNTLGVDLLDNDEHYEPGWLLLNRIFEPLGFFAMIAFLAALNCFVYYRFTHKYVPPDYYWFALFLYTFNPHMMLVNASAMRQSLAGVVFLVAVDYLVKKQVIKYVLCIALAASFHTSALVLLPLLVLAIYEIKISTLLSVTFFILFLSLFLFSSAIDDNLKFFLSLYFDNYYKFYDEPSELGSGLGILFNASIMLVILYYARSWVGYKQTLALVSICYFFLIPFGLLIMMIARLGMYFMPAMMAVYPFVFISIKNRPLRSLLILGISFMIIHGYYTFFQSDVWRDAFSTYQTILSSPAFY